MFLVAEPPGPRPVREGVVAMYARSTTVRGDPQAIDRGIAEVRDTILPAISEMEGCVGLSMLVDRMTGTCIVTTAWETEQALAGSRERVHDLRRHATESLGAGESEVREYEIAVLHRERPVNEGACARVTWLQVPPDRVDAQLQVYRDNVLTRIQELPGFCSASMFVDRSTGRAAGAVTFDSRDALERSRAAAATIRADAVRTIGAEVLDVAEFEVALAHLRVPERV